MNNVSLASRYFLDAILGEMKDRSLLTMKILGSTMSLFRKEKGRSFKLKTLTVEIFSDDYGRHLTKVITINHFLKNKNVSQEEILQELRQYFSIESFDFFHFDDLFLELQILCDQYDCVKLIEYKG